MSLAQAIIYLKTDFVIPIIRIKGNSMISKKTVFVLLISLFICVSAVWAGDTAVFVDLGFSPDGRTYMFGQYGVQSPSLRPWAEIFVVDMTRNAFVPDGRVSYTQPSAIAAGQDGSGVLYTLLSNNISLTSRNNINFQNQGLPLYISRDENPPRAGETIDFRDFITGKHYTARLIPSINGSGADTRSSFYINLEVRSQDGRTASYTVGTPNFVRQKIASYNIKRVLINAGGDSLIFVIEMKRIADNGHDIRYMVEALRF
jgi:predicted secreted protein